MRMDRTRSDGPVVSGLSAAGFRVDDNVYRALAITPVSTGMRPVKSAPR